MTQLNAILSSNKEALQNLHDERRKQMKVNTAPNVCNNYYEFSIHSCLNALIAYYMYIKILFVSFL